jgi:hypothetical protein
LPADKRWRQKPIRAFVVLTLFCVGLMPGMAREAIGDEFKLTPSLAVKEEYNDNILYTQTNTRKDFISTISPGLSLTDRTERMDIYLSGRLDHRLYSSHNDLNATDQYYESTGKYALTPKLNLSGKALYSRDSRPDSDLETTGLSLLTNVTRNRQNYAISSDYLLSEKTMATFSYDYLNDTYDAVLYNDLESHTFNLGFVRDMSNILESTKARMNMGYAKYNMPGINIDNYEATIGIDRAFNEKWNLLFDGGARYTISETRFTTLELVQPLPPLPFFSLVPVEKTERNRGWGMVGQLALTYKGERDSGNLSVVHDISPASGHSGSTERTSFAFYVSRRFSYELYGTLSGGYYINKSKTGEYSTQKIDENMMRISPGIRYEFDKDKAIEASYTYNKTKYNVRNTEAQRNTFFVRYRIQHHLFE